LLFAQPDAQKSFDKIKTLSGSWEGTLTTMPVEPTANGKHAQLSLRVTSMGNAVVHEMRIEGRQDDPITMLYLDSGRLYLTHYCDAGNRPRMVARRAGDGKTVEFDFVDVAGNMQYGHMDHAVITVVDENHHIEDWTYLGPDNKPTRAHFDFHRTK
jgi:hypothetical protein